MTSDSQTMPYDLPPRAVQSNEANTRVHAMDDPEYWRVHGPSRTYCGVMLKQYSHVGGVADVDCKNCVRRMERLGYRERA